MNDSHDPRLAAVERRLDRRLPAEPPPALRHRVLMAVDDLLARPRPLEQDADASIPGWAWATAAAAALFMVVSTGAVAATLRPASPPSLAARLYAAGVTDESLLAQAEPTTNLRDPAIAPPRARPDTPPASRRHLLIEFRKRLEEHL